VGFEYFWQEEARDGVNMDKVIVTDKGFASEDWTGRFCAPDRTQAIGGAVDLSANDDPAVLDGWLNGIALIRVNFSGFADGRGFTLAARLRRMGFTGRLRARGHLIADQYAMARRSGFDEVEISPELARRQPADQWLSRADWAAHDYQARLRG